MFVQIENLVYQYRGASQPAIKNFSLQLNKGEIIAILGESGSGKSTILRLLTGLETPKSGRIVINGKKMVDDHTFIPPEKRGIGMVFQDYALFPHMTVEDNIKFGLRHMTKKQKQNRLYEMLELVDLLDYKKRYPYELSEDNSKE